MSAFLSGIPVSHADSLSNIERDIERDIECEGGK